MSPSQPPFHRFVLSFALPLLLLLHQATAQYFQDVSARVGIDHSMGPKKKYGGPTVVDLNADGHPDLIFVHHDKWFIEIYINNGDGTFNKRPFDVWKDAHAINPFRPSPRTKDIRFAVSPGGGDGTKPAPPILFQYSHRSGAISDVSKFAGVNGKGGRGRSSLFLPLHKSRRSRPDAIFTNAEVVPGFEPQQFGYLNKGRGKFSRRRLRGLATTTNEFIIALDLENDGKMEVLTFQDLKLYRVIAPFKFKDVTASLLPTGIDLRATISVSEFDYDGDGDMDLYICRTNTGNYKWLNFIDTPDYLFENRNGKFYDVTKKSGIPQDSATRAVTAADFNNDGLMDLYITQYKKPDLLLVNTGRKSFRTVSGLIPRPGNVYGDSAQAVDYDSDGRVDLIVGQGDRDLEAHGGFYRVFKNQLQLNNKRGYLLVRVGNAPDRSATSMHALVTVTGKGGFKAVRRVGSPGTAVSNSYIEVVHVGLGWRRKVNVKVKWTSGRIATKYGVGAGSKFTMGVL